MFHQSKKNNKSQHIFWDHPPPLWNFFICNFDTLIIFDFEWNHKDKRIVKERVVYFYTLQHMEHMYLDQLELVNKNRKKNQDLWEPTPFKKRMSNEGVNEKSMKLLT